MTLSELTTFLKRIDAKPKRHLSQNFLIDPNVVKNIVKTASIGPGDTVLEIGPGTGALTSALLATGAKVIAIEKDGVLAKELPAHENLKVFEADILKFPIEKLPPDLKVVANLPYHITTPILEKIFSRPFLSLTIMVQKEVAERMIAQEGSKTFGSLSIFVQFYSQLHSSFAVPAACFYPKPKVDSTVIRLDAKKPPDVDATLFFRFVHKAFQKRRKMLTSSISLPKEDVRKALAQLDVRPDARPEALSFENWVKLVLLLSKQT